MSAKSELVELIKANGLVSYLKSKKGPADQPRQVGKTEQVNRMLTARLVGSNKGDKNLFNYVVANKRRAEALGVQAEAARKGQIMQEWRRSNIKLGTKGYKLDPVTKRVTADPDYYK